MAASHKQKRRPGHGGGVSKGNLKAKTDCHYPSSADVASAIEQLQKAKCIAGNAVAYLYEGELTIDQAESDVCRANRHIDRVIAFLSELRRASS
jgi:hypothetical protein